VTGYRRVIAFKPNEAPQVDTGVYVHDGSFVFYDRRLPDDQVIDADEWVTVVVTRAANDVVRGYVDGVQQFSFVDDQNRAAIQRFLRFFKDDPNDEESSGAVARIRIWDGPLTPAQVAGLGQ